jgi:hypothetical protein
MNRKAQSALEYAVLVSVVLAAIIAMTAYCQKAVNYRVGDIRLEYMDP